MKRCRSALVADPDPDFRDSVVNHLLISGVETLVEVESGREVVQLLSQLPLDLIIIDYALYKRPSVRSTIEGRRQHHQSLVVITLDEDHPSSSRQAFEDSEIQLCILKSSARRMLAALAAGNPA